MSDVVGLALRDGQVDVVALRERLGTPRLVTAFSVPADEDAAAVDPAPAPGGGGPRRGALRWVSRVARWSPRRWSCRRSPARISARWSGSSWSAIFPSRPAEALFDFEVLSSEAGRPLRVLLVAVERRSQERIREILRDAGLTPRLVGVGIHSLARLVTGDAGRGRIVLWLEASRRGARRGRPRAGRGEPRVPGAGRLRDRGRALEAEIRRTLAALPESDRSEVAEVVVGGLPPPAFEVESAAGSGGNRRRRRPSVADGREPAGPGRRAPARVIGRLRWRTSCPTTFARARSPGRWPPRPRWPSSPSAIGAAIPAVTFVKERRALATLDASIARLAPEVQRAERLAAEVERARRELATLRGLRGAGAPSPAGAPRAHRHAPRRRVADEPFRRSQRTRAGRVRQRRLAAHSAARGLARPRARRVHLAGDEGSGPRAVPASRRLGAAWRSALGCRLFVPASAVSSSLAGLHRDRRGGLRVRRRAPDRGARRDARAGRGPPRSPRAPGAPRRAVGSVRPKELADAPRGDRPAPPRRLLAGDKAPVAASELQKLVKTTAQEAGIEVRSERILAPVDRGGYAEVPVEMTLSGPIRGLIDVSPPARGGADPRRHDRPQGASARDRREPRPVGDDRAERVHPGIARARAPLARPNAAPAARTGG